MKWQKFKELGLSSLSSAKVFLFGLWQLLVAPFALGFILFRGAAHILLVMIIHVLDTPRRRYKAKEIWQNLRAGDCFCCYESNPYLALNKSTKHFLIVKVLHADGKIHPDFFYDSYGRHVVDREQLNVHLLVYPNRFDQVPTADQLRALPQVALTDVGNAPNLNAGFKTSILSLPKNQFCDPDHWVFMGRTKVTKEEMLYFAAKSLRHKAYQPPNTA